jgi:hypothetical protein
VNSSNNNSNQATSLAQANQVEARIQCSSNNSSPLRGETITIWRIVDVRIISGNEMLQSIRKYPVQLLPMRVAVQAVLAAAGMGSNMDIVSNISNIKNSTRKSR